MKFNHELAEKILLFLENALEAHDGVVKIDGYDENEISYHIKHLADEWLILAQDASTFAGEKWLATDLTFRGHEVLDKSRTQKTTEEKQTKDLSNIAFQKTDSSNQHEIDNSYLQEPQNLHEISKNKDPYRLKGLKLADRYYLVGYVGGGGMGAVYLSKDENSKKWCAVKILKPDVAARNADYIRFFEQEIEAAKKLDHPNIVRIFDSGTEDDLSFMVMEWLEGDTLENEIRKGHFEIEVIRDIFQQICSAFILAHAENILHLDIKPANIFLKNTDTAKPFIKVIDFGLAKILSSESGTTVTRFQGTHQYCSPEHFGGKFTNRSDIYSLGATLYNMITGVIPFSTSYIYAKQFPNLELPQLPSVLRIRPELPKQVDGVIRKALSKNPADRQESVQMLLKEFKQAIVSEIINDKNEINYAAIEKSAKERKFSQLINYNTLTDYLHMTFHNRKHSEPPEVCILVEQLTDAGYKTIGDIENLINYGLQAFLEYEQQASMLFGDVGVIRILANIADENFLRVWCNRKGMSEEAKTRLFNEETQKFEPYRKFLGSKD